MSKKPLIDELVDDFLRWPLPDSVCADGCATKQGPGRVGTNLLSAVEAKEMFEAVVLPKLATTASTAQAAPLRSAEAYFIEQDLFALYVEAKVNPARKDAGLDTIGSGAARHLFSVITEGRYR